jgi:aquaporin Z
LKTKFNLGKYTAEAIATFALVFCGTAAIAVNEISGGVITHVGISLVFGLIVLAMIYAVGHISGAHMNPAVSLAFVSVRRLPLIEFFPYCASQAIGAFAASGLVKIIFPTSQTLGVTQPHGAPMQSFVLEIVLALILMFVIMGVAHDDRAEGEMAGISIGGTVALEALFAGPISGASMNPFRSLGPAMVTGNLNNIWIYLIGPPIGTCLGAFLYRLLQFNSVQEDVMQKTKVLFVCIHNSARSQMAEALLKK